MYNVGLCKINLTIEQQSGILFPVDKHSNKVLTSIFSHYHVNIIP